MIERAAHEGGGSVDGEGRGGGVPGKRTRSERLAPTDARARPAAMDQDGGDHAAAGARDDEAQDLAALDDPFGMHLLGGDAAAGTLTVADDDTSPSARFDRATIGAAAEVPYRAEMERSFGQDFAGVRAFTGRGPALDLLGAEAATRDDRIAFADPSPTKDVVAHELAHVAQGRAHGTGAALQAKDAVSSPSHPAEVEADAIAARVVRGEPVRVSAAPQAALALRTRGQMVAVGKGVKIKLSAEADPLPAGTHQVTIDALTAAQVKALADDAEVAVTVLVANSLVPRQGKLAARYLNRGTFVDVAGGGKSLASARAGMGGPAVVGSGAAAAAASASASGLPAAAAAHGKAANPDEDGGTANANFTRPVAVGVDGPNVVVHIPVHTLNRYDRIGWSYKLVSSQGARIMAEDPTWWNNPAWAPGKPPTKLGATLPAHGAGAVGVRRIVAARIPIAPLRAHFEKDGGLKDTSMITFGMKLWYGGDGPTTATKAEFATAYGDPRTDHNWGYTRGDDLEGAVDLTPVRAALGLGKGEWLTDAEIGELPLPENPSPNKLKDFPADYARTNPAFAPLQPAGGPGKLATRIENEATLKISSQAKLGDLIAQLAKAGAAINGVMRGGPQPLPLFNWTLAPEGAPMVFTDIYMDDPALHALMAGVGIRKRMSTTATKLNVKTGAGYNVGKLGKDGREYRRDPDPASAKPGDDEMQKSDIFRRHEIGFDINPAATAADIGAFLAAGLDEHGDGRDPWNRGAEQANLTVAEHDEDADDDEDTAIDFGKLRETMVLQGHRTKFKLQAIKVGEHTPINIEISCDHTVGRSFDAFREDAEPADLFNDLHARYKHAYNIELELEHLGAKAPPPADDRKHDKPSGAAAAGGPGSGGAVGGAAAGHAAVAPAAAPAAIPPGHPGRMYMRDDTTAPQFNTPSFELFYRAHEHLIAWMRTLLDDKAGSELGQDQQKLESLRDQLLGDAQIGPNAPAPKPAASGAPARPGAGGGPPKPGPGAPPPPPSGSAAGSSSMPPRGAGDKPAPSGSGSGAGALAPSGASGKAAPSGAGDKAAPSGYQIDVAGRVKLGNLGLVEVPVAPDGDCFYASIIRTAGLATTVKALRDRVADEIQDHPDKYRASIVDITPREVADRIRAMGSYAGQDGDIAVAVLPVLLGLAVSTMNRQGVITPPQSAGTPITLIRFTGGGKSDHYHATRRMG